MIRKRVLIFSTAYLPFIGGAELAVQEITKRIPEVDFVLLTARLKVTLPEREQMGNVEVFRIGKGSAFDKIRLIFQGPKLAASLGSFSFVWSIMASYSGFAAVTYKKKHPAVPYLLTLQEGDSFSHIYARVWFVWGWFKQIFTKADHVQAISSYLADWAKKMGAVCPVTVIPNGVDLMRFSQDNIKKAFPTYDEQHAKAFQRYTTLKLKQNEKLIVSASRLVKKNGLDYLIHALEFLSPTVHLVIVGGGEEEDKLRKLSKILNIESRVHLVGEIKHEMNKTVRLANGWQEELPHFLWLGDVFCRPSRSEGLGTAFLESMAMGIPIVAPSIGGVKDFLRDGETGLVCNQNNPKDIAEKIQKILNDPDLTRRLAENGRKLVEEQYSWDIVAQKIKNLF